MWPNSACRTVNSIILKNVPGIFYYFVNGQTMYNLLAKYNYLSINCALVGHCKK